MSMKSNKLNLYAQTEILDRGTPNHITKMIQNVELHPYVKWQIAKEYGNANQNHISELIDHQRTNKIDHGEYHDRPLHVAIVQSSRANAEKLMRKHDLHPQALEKYHEIKGAHEESNIMFDKNSPSSWYNR